MDVDSWLTWATQKLEKSSIMTARLDALVLLEDTTSKNRSWLLAHPEFKINSQLQKNLAQSIERRSKHEPLAYIRNKSDFYGREFIITPATLQPRPETETMIEVLKTLELPEQAKVADIGTGSGAIAITIRLELPGSTVYATEINQDALDIAKMNAKNLRTNIHFYLGDLLAPLIDLELDIITANLPYVPDARTINKAAMQEPKVAIFGGKDGLDLYRALFAQLFKREQKPRFILTESLPFQHEDLKNIAKRAGYIQKQVEDFIQVFHLK